jgi:hypothetical protein
MCRKLEIYGFHHTAIRWMKSFLSNRFQIVKIGDSTSNRVPLKSGVPQGGILSPLLYIIYVADLEDWLEWSRAITYADDTSTSYSSQLLNTVTSNLEKDAINVLNFMASNGLVANPNKTVFMLMNCRLVDDKPIDVKVGNVMITQVHHAKLLGMSINDKQKWSVQIREAGGLIPSLNKRLFQIRRLKNTLTTCALKKVAESIYISKLRYGVQLLGKIRWNTDDTTTADLRAVQITFNKLARMINNVTLKDRTANVSLFDNLGWLSFNQMNAQVKLLEAWKMLNVPNYPNKLSPKEQNSQSRTTRAITNGEVVEPGKTKIGTSTFISDAARAWNRTSGSLKNFTTLTSAKKAIKSLVKELPF